MHMYKQPVVGRRGQGGPPIQFLFHLLDEKRGGGAIQHHLSLVPPPTDEGQQDHRDWGQPKPHSQLVTSLELETRLWALPNA